MPCPRKNLNITGSNLWYLVGLITSDGNLSSDGRHIDITSIDKDHLEELRKRTGLVNKVSIKNKGMKNKAYRIQIANKNLYDFLLSLGLMPKKSLILQRVSVPEKFFFDFLRGVVDADGGIQRWRHSGNREEQWNLRVTSGSSNFLLWIQNRIDVLIGSRGKLYSEGPTKHRLKYGKMAAKRILERCYYKDCLGLSRKMTLAKVCLSSQTGWSKCSRSIPQAI